MLLDLYPGQLMSEKYELISKIGQGGFGSVWKARYENEEKFVAIKFVSRNIVP